VSGSSTVRTFPFPSLPKRAAPRFVAVRFFAHLTANEESHLVSSSLACVPAARQNTLSASPVVSWKFLRPCPSLVSSTKSRPLPNDSLARARSSAITWFEHSVPFPFPFFCCSRRMLFQAASACIHVKIIQIVQILSVLIFSDVPARSIHHTCSGDFISISTPGFVVISNVMVREGYPLPVFPSRAGHPRMRIFPSNRVPCRTFLTNNTLRVASALTFNAHFADFLA